MQACPKPLRALYTSRRTLKSILEATGSRTLRLKSSVFSSFVFISSLAAEFWISRSLSVDFSFRKTSKRCRSLKYLKHLLSFEHLQESLYRANVSEMMVTMVTIRLPSVLSS